MTWGAIGVAAVGVVGSYMSKKSASKAQASAQAAADPYAQYRPAAALKLNNLMNEPNTLDQLPEFRAYQQAASRTMASQGYTGSGNALVAAAQAGGNAYQQAFSNLSTLSGAGYSPSTAVGIGQQAGQQAYGNSQQNQENLMGLAGNAYNAFQNRGGGVDNPSNPNYMPPINVPMDKPQIALPVTGF